MSIGEVQALLKLIEKPSMHCYFTVVYHLGLRLNEALHLQISDIDSKRMMVHIHRGKGAPTIEPSNPIVMPRSGYTT